MNPPAAARVLLVDDEPLILRAYSAMLAARGHTVTTASSGIEALEVLRGTQFDVIVSDVSMAGLDGIELLRRVREQDLDVPVIIITGAPSVDTATRAIEQGVTRYLVKPVRMAELCDAVAQAHKLHGLAKLKRQALELMGRTDKQLGDRAGLEVRMEAALAGILMYYQPIVSWPDRSVMAYEALVRSREPTLANPAALIAAAERLDRVHELGRCIRREIATGLETMPAGLRMFVNLHPQDFLDEDLFDPRAPLSRHASRVVLEITERASLDDVTDLRGRVGRLRALGYSIAVDDLGAGYAGLSSLAQLEPDLVKLDMSLSRGIDASPTQQLLVRSMASLCAEMGTRCVVEGVETQAELDTLVGLGADLLQGYYFAKPAPPFPDVSWPEGEAPVAAASRKA